MKALHRHSNNCEGERMIRPVRMSRVAALILAATIAHFALVALGCGGKKNRVRTVPDPPQYASIKAACLEHKKSKDNGDKQVPIEREQDALRMLVDSWENYEYAKKEMAKQAVTIMEIRTIAAVDLEVAAGQVQKAQAERDRYKAQRWYFLGGGVAAGVVMAILVGLAL